MASGSDARLAANVLLLSDLIGRADTLELACDRCGRHGRLSDRPPSTGVRIDHRLSVRVDPENLAAREPGAMTKRPKQQPKPQPEKPCTWIIESGTRGVYVGGKYAERATNWPLFSWSPDPARIVRFDDEEAAKAEADLRSARSSCHLIERPRAALLGISYSLYEWIVARPSISVQARSAKPISNCAHIAPSAAERC
jgi:hypothetical protein